MPWAPAPPPGTGARLPATKALIGDEQAVQKSSWPSTRAPAFGGPPERPYPCPPAPLFRTTALGVDTVGRGDGAPGSAISALASRVSRSRLSCREPARLSPHALHRVQSLLRLLGIDSRLRQRPSPSAGLGLARIFLLLLGILGESFLKCSLPPRNIDSRMESISFSWDTILSKFTGRRLPQPLQRSGCCRAGIL